MEHYYYEVIPASRSGHARLTYHSEQELAVGQIVRLPLGKQQAWGVVATKGVTGKPAFATRAIGAITEWRLPPQLLELAEWLADYYAITLAQSLSLMLPLRPDLPGKSPLLTSPPTPAKLHLSTGQTEAIAAIKAPGPPANWLLHGVTGSGKTEVYLRLAAEVLVSGRSVIILTPEIALATQVMAEFQAAFGKQVILNHSGLSGPARRGLWQHCAASCQPLVIIGPRSSLFLPLPSVGLIVIDECHDSSYKQEQAPRYHAREVAAKLASLHGATLLLGSATPSVSDSFLASKGKLRLLELPETIHTARRQVEIIDQRGSRELLSQPLQAAMAATLQRGEQTILFLNRRGSAALVLCESCGAAITCPHCHLPHSWHADQGRLRCHLCGRSEVLPGKCPDCGSLKWRFVGLGTKKVEVAVRQLFPAARVTRLDRDSFSAATIAETIKQLRVGDIDILIGTQMIAKGLDVPGVSLVGVVLADTMLHLPDVASAERTYQLLHQVSGRAGRRHGAEARVIIQTYAPESPVITAAARQDYAGFLDRELAERQSLGYPPFVYFVKLSARRKSQRSAEGAAQKLAGALGERYGQAVTVRGPAPAWWEQRRGYFHWQLVVSARSRSVLTEIARELPSGWQHDLDPINLL